MGAMNPTVIPNHPLVASAATAKRDLLPNQARQDYRIGDPASPT
jgi:hypothetical protein